MSRVHDLADRLEDKQAACKIRIVGYEAWSAIQIVLRSYDLNIETHYGSRTPRLLGQLDSRDIA